MIGFLFSMIDSLKTCFPLSEGVAIAHAFFAFLRPSNAIFELLRNGKHDCCKKPIETDRLVDGKN